MEPMEVFTLFNTAMSNLNKRSTDEDNVENLENNQFCIVKNREDQIGNQQSYMAHGKTESGENMQSSFVLKTTEDGFCIHSKGPENLTFNAENICMTEGYEGTSFREFLDQNLGQWLGSGDRKPEFANCTLTTFDED